MRGRNPIRAGRQAGNTVSGTSPPAWPPAANHPTRAGTIQQNGTAVKIELEVPGDWTPGQTLATRASMQHVVRAGHPIVAAVRRDATPEQLEHIYRRLRALLRETSLAA